MHDLYEITPLSLHPTGLGKVHCSSGIINEASSQTIYVNVLFKDH